MSVLDFLVNILSHSPVDKDGRVVRRVQLAYVWAFARCRRGVDELITIVTILSRENRKCSEMMRCPLSETNCCLSLLSLPLPVLDIALIIQQVTKLHIKYHLIIINTFFILSQPFSKDFLPKWFERVCMWVISTVSNHDCPCFSVCCAVEYVTISSAWQGGFCCYYYLESTTNKLQIIAQTLPNITSVWVIAETNILAVSEEIR